MMVNKNTQRAFLAHGAVGVCLSVCLPVHLHTPTPACVSCCAPVVCIHQPCPLTGVLVLDRVNGVAYVALSERADKELAEQWVSLFMYIHSATQGLDGFPART